MCSLFCYEATQSPSTFSRRTSQLFNGYGSSVSWTRYQRDTNCDQLRYAISARTVSTPSRANGTCGEEGKVCSNLTLANLLLLILKRRSITLVGEADRKVLKAAIKRAAGEDQVKHRTIAPEIVAKWSKKLESLKGEIAGVLQDEKEEKQVRMRQLIMIWWDLLVDFIG